MFGNRCRIRPYYQYAYAVTNPSLRNGDCLVAMLGIEPNLPCIMQKDAVGTPGHLGSNCKCLWSVAGDKSFYTSTDCKFHSGVNPQVLA